MAHQKTQSQAQSTGNDSTIEVLYQKMGDRWFAFSLIDDEVFVGSISQSEIDSKTSADPATNTDPRAMKVHRKIGSA